MKYFLLWHQKENLFRFTILNRFIDSLKHILLFGGMLLLLSCNPHRSVKSLKHPNIIIILTDDQGWGDLSMNGNPDLHTPNIDRLAEQGVVFENFFVCPLCAPTRAEMLTGRYYPRTGVSGVSEGRERMDLDETTIADVFKENGYKTAAFGKWHNGMQYPYHPNGRGFDEFYGFCSGHWGNYFSPILDHNGDVVKGKGYLSDDLTKRAIQFMEENREQPFFLYLPLNIPHSPMQVPDEWWNKFKDKEITTSHRYKDREDLDHTRAAYAMCENIDWNVGRLMEKLEMLGLEENTIVIYFSDNGPNGWRWNGGMKGKKGHTDEGGVRSPLIMRWTGTIEAGKKVKPIAGAIDLLPTLTNLAGIEFEPEKKWDGINLKPLIFEDNPQWNERMIVSTWRDATSVRSRQYRLDRDNKLFDMIEDPGQMVDISKKNTDIYRELLKFKEEWMADVLSELPDTDTRTFPIGHPGFKYNQLPARDATPHGNIKRSSIHPNCSFLTNWMSLSDSISWEVEVLEDGEFEAIIYYTCREGDEGSTLELISGSRFITSIVDEAHDPPLEGRDRDRVERDESYTKDFIPLSMGNITLEKGNTTIILKALDIPGNAVIDFRLMMLNKI